MEVEKGVGAGGEDNSVILLIRVQARQPLVNEWGFIVIRSSKHAAHHISAAEGQERAMRKRVLIRHGNKSAENQWAP